RGHLGPAREPRPARPLLGALGAAGVTCDVESLFEAVELEPDDLERWAVLSDALCSSGDPRGELLALFLAGRPVGDAERGPHLAHLLGRVLSRFMAPILACGPGSGTIHRLP